MTPTFSLEEAEEFFIINVSENAYRETVVIETHISAQAVIHYNIPVLRDIAIASLRGV